MNTSDALAKIQDKLAAGTLLRQSIRGVTFIAKHAANDTDKAAMFDEIIAELTKAAESYDSCDAQEHR